MDQLTDSLIGKVQRINELFDALAPNATLRIHRSATLLLTLGFYGGPFKGTVLADQTTVLPVSSTSYVEANATTGAVSSNTVGYTTGKIPLGVAVTSATGLTSWTTKDNQTWPTTP